ncbi:MAG: radical SAM protein [candidate division WOR-3 bacterium]
MKIFFYQMGCKLNQTLTKKYIGKNLVDGHTFCDNPNDADIILLSSCIVTETSQKQFETILKRMSKRFPEKKIKVIGCYDVNLLNENIEYIDQNDAFHSNTFYINRTRVEIPIQIGCNSFCSYCIVPYYRGEEKSRDVKMILKEVEELSKNNIKEIVLTGVHIGRFSNEGKNLVDLVNLVAEKPIERIRLSSLDINEIDEKGIERMAKVKKLVPFFHLSLQHISQKVLKMMKRKYNVQRIKEIMIAFKENFDRPMLGCDIIVGFPFETDQDFIEMVEFFKESYFSHFHIFPFSRRKESLAYYFENVKDTKIQVEEKMEIMRKLHKEKKEEFLKSLKGINETIIFESFKDDMIKGKSERYFDGYLKYDNKFQKGDIIKVKVLDFVDGKVFCEERNF